MMKTYISTGALIIFFLGLNAAAQGQEQPMMPSQAQQPSSNPFLGSAPAAAPAGAPVPLSLKDAVTRALQYNLGLLLQEEALKSAHGARWRALADLLPNVSASAAERRQVINLEAFGFKLKPSIVGPFNIVDMRLYVSQPVIDLSALSDARAASFNERAEARGVRSARDLVVLVAVNLYLEAVAASSRIDVAKAQQATAEALQQQAADLKASGVVAGIDVLRAQVQTATERQRLIVAQNDFEKAKLQLARAIGLPVSQQFTLTDKIPYAALPDVALDAALKRAYESRSDYLAAQDRLAAAEASRRAAAADLLPSLHVDGDYGAIGQTSSPLRNTYTIAATVHVPLFDAGRTHARRIEAESLVARRQAEVADFKGRVEFEVRTALLDVSAASEQLTVAQTNVTLANQELQQARDRFAAGIASNIEVTQAQEAVAAAAQTYISALYAHNLAKASLARAVGGAEQEIMRYLGGQQ
jgi:outer membrane protein TolC